MDNSTSDQPGYLSITTDVRVEVARVELDLHRLLAALGSRPSEVSLSELDHAVQTAKGLVRRIEAERVNAVESPMKYVKAVNLAARAISDPLKSLASDAAAKLLEEKARRDAAEQSARDAMVALARAAVADGRGAEAVHAVGASFLDAMDAEEERDKIVTKARKGEALEIEDPLSIPFELNGIQLLEPKRAAIIRLLRAGVHVPGCRLVKTETT